MIFDEFIADAPHVREDAVHLFRADMRSRIAFDVEESIFRFIDQDGLDEIFDASATPTVLPSPLPFERVALCFDNAILLLQVRNHPNGWPALLQIIEYDCFTKDRPLPTLMGDDGQRLRMKAVRGAYRNWSPAFLETTLRYDPQGQWVGVVDAGATDPALRAAFKSEEPDLESLPLAEINPGSRMELHGWRRGHEIVVRFLTFLTCTNVRAIDVVPTSKEQRHRRTIGRPPLVSFKRLQLQPKSGSSAAASEGGWTNRVHLCRGHFATYTPEAPLFGKYVGRFWIPPHARGNAQRGIVEKTYGIKPADFGTSST